MIRPAVAIWSDVQKFSVGCVDAVPTLTKVTIGCHPPLYVTCAREPLPSRFRARVKLKLWRLRGLVVRIMPVSVEAHHGLDTVMDVGNSIETGNVESKRLPRALCTRQACIGKVISLSELEGSHKRVLSLEGAFRPSANVPGREVCAAGILGERDRPV